MKHSRNGSILRTLILTGWLMLSLTVGTFQAKAQSFGFGDDETEQLVDVVSVFSISTAAPGGVYEAAVIVDIASGWHINSATPYQDYLIAAEVQFGSIDGFVPGELIYPRGSDATLGEERMSVYDDRVVIPFEIAIDSEVAAGTYVLPVTMTYQPCNDTECRAPEDAEVPLKIVIGAAGRPINEAIFGSLNRASEATAPAPQAAEADSELEQIILDYGAWGYVLVLGVAFVTGLVLSFSPCTYPMIPITVSIFAGQERSVGRGFFLSLIYVGTMAFIYGIMGLIVSAVGGVFGAWLASPPVVIGIVIVFVVFSLSMFGLYDLNVPASLRNKLGTTQTGGGVVGSIILGVVAALVVSPCVGPFVAGILLYIATSGSLVVGFFTLFFFALGLGTLFVIIGTFSSAITRLPKSGDWMESVKKFFGFILLLMAIYFLQPLVSVGVTALITALLLLAFGVFGGGLDRLTSEAGFFLRLKKFLGVLALLVGTYLLLGLLFSQGFLLPAASHWLPSAGGVTAVEETGIKDWETDLDAGLARALAENRPVIIDTWATWCANCRVLEKKTFSKPEVGVEAERFVAIKIQLEKNDSPETIAFQSKFGLKTYSLPTTLLLNSQGEIHKIITGVIGPEDLIAEMQLVR
jgi:thiol:disulfide interchange protein DsbD